MNLKLSIYGVQRTGIAEGGIIAPGQLIPKLIYFLLPKITFVA
jgi:hypothetical protein